jgi:prolyl-tRNA editing enzyme YbaK/EbsC (Cys-tRNA(Pro) deacylase)
MKELKVFVGSSIEAKEDDKFIRRILESNDITPIAWRDVFHPGEFSLDSLINISNKVHGAIIISTADDKIWYRGKEGLAPRDNILFEMGLFIRALGKKHVALIFCKDVSGQNPKIPTDIHGLNVIFFEKNKELANEIELEKWIHMFKQSSHPVSFHLSDSVRILGNNFHKIPETWIDEIKNYILHPFEEMSQNALSGEFILNTSQYYDSLLTKLNISNSGTKIRAISLVSPEVWAEDPHQKRFYDFNVKAKKNGARFQRLFVVSDEQITNYWKIIQKQLKDGFEVKTIHPRIFSEHINLDDSIIFENLEEIRCYKTIQFYDNPYKLKGARLILNHNVCKEQINSFNQIWQVAKTPSILKYQIKKNHLPPGLKMKAMALRNEVVTCEEAAKARGIPLINELKTLILQTPNGFIAAHIPGDGELSLRAVKMKLALKNVKIADPEKIANIGLHPGTVCAILNPVWDMPHLISKRLLSLEFVMTNNGTKIGYFKLDPIILLNATSTIIEDFEKHF